MQQQADTECAAIAGTGFTANGVDKQFPHGTNCSATTDCAKIKNQFSQCENDTHCRTSWASMMIKVCTKQEMADEWKLEPVHSYGAK